MATWQIKEFEEVPFVHDGEPIGHFSGEFFCDSDGEIVEINVNTQTGKTIQISEPIVGNPTPNPLFRGLRAGIEMVYRNELLDLRNEIERKSENAYCAR